MNANARSPVIDTIEADLCTCRITKSTPAVSKNMQLAFYWALGISVCNGWGGRGLSRDFKDSMILEKAGLFHGSLQFNRSFKNRSRMKKYKKINCQGIALSTYLAQQDSIIAATCGFTSLGISSLLPLKPTAATTCHMTIYFIYW